MLPARLEDGALTLEDGQVLPVVSARVARYAAFAGRPMLLGIRPEHLAARARPGSAPLNAAVEVVEPMGMETMVHFRLGATASVARLPPETEARPGAVLPLHADMNQMHLIDPATGAVV